LRPLSPSQLPPSHVTKTPFTTCGQLGQITRPPPYDALNVGMRRVAKSSNLGSSAPVPLPEVCGHLTSSVNGALFYGESASTEAQVLLMADDEARKGALRFAETEGGRFERESSGTPIPSLAEIPKLLAAAEHVEEGTETDDEINLLSASGALLGGARPKVSVRDRDGVLALAKFPHRNDDIRIELWEAVALLLASQAGIEVPQSRIEMVGGKPVLLLRRFDRRGVFRIPFLSAMSMLGAIDREPRSYMDIADAIRRYGANA